MLKLRRFLMVVCFLGLAPLTLQGGDRGTHRRSDDRALFSEAEYKKNIEYLASDALEGRGTGQEGNEKAGEYIADAFRAYGLKPGGDKGSYFQNFTLKLKKRVAPGTRLAIGTRGRTLRHPALLHDDYVPLPYSSNGAFSGDVVFVGYGISSDEHHYDDFKDIDVTDKVVLMLRRSPKFAEFDMMDASFRAKASRAASRDAAAVLIVNPVGDEEGQTLYNFDNNSTMGMGRGESAFGVPMLHIKASLANQMLKAAGMPTIEALQKKIESTKKPQSAALKGVNVKGMVRVEPVESPVRNVVGILPGSGPQSDEYIVVGGHYDHLGIRKKGMPEFNSKKDIYNGADDNGSGTTAVMLLARAYSKGERPNRSIVFMCYTGEELGLLGSAYYAKHPTINLKQCVAMLNLDMVGRLKNDKLEVGGMRTGAGFEKMVRGYAEPYHLTITDGGGGRGPSDHTSFYNKDIPVLFFFTGLHKQYHQPDDDTPLLNIEGAVRITRLVSDCMDGIDAKEERPAFATDTSEAKITYQDSDAPPARRTGRRGMRLGITPKMSDDQKGLVVNEVAENSPAQKAGIKPDDVIVRIGQSKIKSPMDMFSAVRRTKPGDKVVVELKRGDETLKLDLMFDKAADTQAVATVSSRKDSALAALTALAKAGAEVLPGGEGEVTLQSGTLKVTTRVRFTDNFDASVLAPFKRLNNDDVSDWEVSVTLNKPGAESGPGNITFSASSKSSSSTTVSSLNSGDRTPKAKAKAATPKDPHTAPKDPHAGAGGDEAGSVAMPTVRLGIMPTYHEQEGEGYEISGVVDDGPAAKAGMKASDRIIKIGDQKIKDVYTYMEALRKYKAGDVIPVTVLRDGEKITLKIKASPQRRREAA